MDTVPDTVRWLVLAGADEAMSLLHQAARMNGFRFLPRAAGEVLIEIPRSLFKRRPISRITGHATPTQSGTEIVWACGDEKHRAGEFLLCLEESLPDGTLDYHGLVEAAAASGVLFEGKKAYRNIVNSLRADESVLAVASGEIGEAAGIVALTDRRLLVVNVGVLGPPPLLEAPLDSIGTLTLGKKSSGETVTVGLGPDGVVISRMGYSGDGHVIVAKFRELMNDRARTPAISFVPHDAEGRFDRAEQPNPANGKSTNIQGPE
ncbi:hypothetical protein [Arthrobacter oryzae]|uniref:Uncharacterized protein n=1 Tax=Arthrobacter oryzae TaxID=409290 RepID=A0A3N0C7K4_9MICC|nr:hypothetical protein [Arthrobacter oryzae]RNL59167.1 hypothetical protein D7003_02595 [Arthrobacter oryzae]